VHEIDLSDNYIFIKASQLASWANLKTLKVQCQRLHAG